MNRKTWLYVILYVMLFSSIFILSKQIIPPLNAISYICIRSLIGCIPFFFYFHSNKKKGYLKELLDFSIKNRKLLLGMVLLSHTGSLLILFFATPYTTSSNQSILNSFSGPIIVIINILIYRKKQETKVLLGIIISTIGVLMIVYPFSFSENDTLKGDLLVLTSMALAAFGNIVQNDINKITRPEFISFLLAIIPGVVLFPFLLIGDQFHALASLNFKQWIILAWLGLSVSGLGYTVVSIIYADPSMTAEKFSIINGLVFTTGFFLGIIVLDESFLLVNIFGVFIVLFSVGYVNYKRASKNSVKSFQNEIISMEEECSTPGEKCRYEKNSPEEDAGY